MRVAVYTDYTYHCVDGEIYADRAFALFLTRLSAQLEAMTIAGRLDPTQGKARYRLGDHVDFAPLPFYPSLNHPLSAAIGMGRSLGRFWKLLATVDRVWLLGPHPLAFAFALMAFARRRKVFLGVRQDSVEYMRRRHPNSRLRVALAVAMEKGFRVLAKRCSGTVAVGPQIASAYSNGTAVLKIAVSLIDEGDLVDPDAAERREKGNDLVALSVGRIDPEKNPLLLADALAALRDRDTRWRFVICGEGTMERELQDRVAELGLKDSIAFLGYVATMRVCETSTEPQAPFFTSHGPRGFPRSCSRHSPHALPWSQPTSVELARWSGTLPSSSPREIHRQPQMRLCGSLRTLP